MASLNLSNHAAFLWSVADPLRGDYKQSDYGKVILPFTVLRRLNCVLAAGIYTDEEIESLVRAALAPKPKKSELLAKLSPAAERFRVRLRDAQEAKDAKARDTLDLFRRNLLAYTRTWDFLSQIIDYGADTSLEKRAIYFRHLAPLLEIANIHVRTSPPQRPRPSRPQRPAQGSRLRSASRVKQQSGGVENRIMARAKRTRKASAGTQAPIGILHLTYQQSHPSTWILRVMTALTQSANPSVRDALSHWGPPDPEKKGLSAEGLSFALVTKMRLLEIVVDRLREDLRVIHRELAADESGVQECLQDKAGYGLKDFDPFRLVVDFHSFLFEARAALETTSLLYARLRDMLSGRGSTAASNKKAAYAAMSELFEQSGASTKWMDQLKKKRDEFVHHDAAWIALRVDQFSPLQIHAIALPHPDYDLAQAETASSTLCVSDWDEIRRGLIQCQELVEKDLLAIIGQKGQARPRDRAVDSWRCGHYGQLASSIQTERGYTRLD